MQLQGVVGMLRVNPAGVGLGVSWTGEHAHEAEDIWPRGCVNVPLVVPPLISASGRLVSIPYSTSFLSQNTLCLSC